MINVASSNALFIGHEYHKKTRSADFFLDIVSEVYDLDFLYIDVDNVQETDFINQISQKLLHKNYDKIFVWQTSQALPACQGHPDVIFFPMHDDARHFTASSWQEVAKTRMFAFSRELHNIALRKGVRSTYVQFWPDTPSELPVYTSDFSAYFWYRNNDTDISALNKIIHRLAIRHITICHHPDPYVTDITSKEQFKSELDCSVSFVDWAQSRDEALNRLSNHQFFIACRSFEGIGMSFLDAMSQGCIVVAPDQPTYNEYILSGYNGLLFSENGEIFSKFTSAKDLFDNTQSELFQGSITWESTKAPLLAAINEEEHASDFLSSPKISPQSETDQPLQTITIVTVTYNAETELAETLDSIVSQDYPALDIILVDGASTDNTLKVAKSYKKHLTTIVSEPDNGPYDAMNKGAALATGNYVLYMNAGDRFCAPTSVRELMAASQTEPDFIVGNHIYIDEDGRRFLHPVGNLHETFSKLSIGALTNQWHSRIPCHQSTATKTELVRNLQYQRDYKVAADHHVMFRAISEGASCVAVNRYIAEYYAGGYSGKNEITCVLDWTDIALKYCKSPEHVESFYLGRLHNAIRRTLYTSGSEKALAISISEVIGAVVNSNFSKSFRSQAMIPVNEYVANFAPRWESTHSNWSCSELQEHEDFSFVNIQVCTNAYPISDTFHFKFIKGSNYVAIELRKNDGAFCLFDINLESGDSLVGSDDYGDHIKLFFDLDYRPKFDTDAEVWNNAPGLNWVVKHAQSEMLKMDMLKNTIWPDIARQVETALAQNIPSLGD